MKRMLFCLVSLLACTAAHADGAQDCAESVTQALAKAAHVSGDVIAQACKPMPGDARATIAVAAFGKADDTSDDITRQQVLGLIDANGRVLAMDHQAVEEDALTAVGPHSYTIDTAPYRLSPDVRAFGVVFHSDARGAVCPDANAYDELTLWIYEGGTLKPVLGTNLNGWVSVEGTACGSGHGEALSEDAHITLAMEKTSTHGFADISLTAKVAATRRTADDDLRDGPKRTAKTLLKYDGKSYGVDMFRDFWYPASLRQK